MFPVNQTKGFLVNVIAKNFSSEEIDEIGKEIFNKFNAHLLSGQPFGIMLQPEVAAKTLVEFSIQNGKMKELTEIIIQVAFGKRKEKKNFSNDSNLQELLKILSFSGFHFRKGILEFTNEKDNWGYLEENKEYYFAYLSIDIVGNSQIQLKYDKNLIQEVYSRFQKLVKVVIEFYDGKIWNWAGDGGIAAFYLDKVEESAVLSAIKIFLELFLFNLDSTRNKFLEPIKLRIGVHSGNSIYKENKGLIFSDAINFVSHLEKNFTDVNHISISKDIYDKINPRIQGIFSSKGNFENKECFTASFNLITKF